jgi:peptide/nickel transport system substrate-binding protein
MLAVLAGLVLLAPGCVREDQPGAGAAAGPPERGGSLVVALGAEPDSLNVYLAHAHSSLLVANRILPRLWKEVPPDAPGDDVLVPELVDGSATFTEDGLALRVPLREDARWSDGRPVTCEDLVFTLAAQTDPDVAWRMASIKRHIAGIECIDDHTAVYRFERRYPGQRMDVNDLHVLPATLAEIPASTWREVDWAERMPAGGAFEVEEVVPGQQVVLRRHEGWFGPDEQPYLDRVVLRIVPESVARVTQLLAGDVHVVTGLSPDDAARIDAHGATRVMRRPGWSYLYVGWNALDPAAYQAYRRERGDQPDDPEALAELARRHPHPVLGDARVRRALTLGIDRPTIIDNLLAGEGEIPSSPILAPLAAHDEKLEPWPYDPQEARRLLAEAGFVDSDGNGALERDGEPLELELLVQAGHRLRRDAAVLIQRDLAELGVRVTLRPVENSAFYPTVAERSMDGWIGRWRVPLRVDMTEMLHAAACRPGGANFGCWTDPEADPLASAARDELDPARRHELWHRWEDIFHREQPYTILFRPRELVGVREEVRGTESILANDELNGIPGWWLAGGSTAP